MLDSKHPQFSVSAIHLHLSHTPDFTVSQFSISGIHQILMLGLNSMRPANEGTSTGAEKKYTGVRRRKWGKWVSEIRVPTTRTRLWLGSYSTPEAAAVAHDAAVFCLRGPSSIDDLNFPSCIPASAHTNLSPTSIQQVATAAGMDVDARLRARFARDISSSGAEGVPWTEQDGGVKWPMPDQVALENSGESGSMVVDSAMPERMQYQGPENYSHLLAVNEDDNGSKFRGGEPSTFFIDDMDSWNFDDMDLRN